MDGENTVENALALAIAMLVHDLDQEGVLSKETYLSSLRVSAANIDANPGNRFDQASAEMLHRVADLAEYGPDWRGWTPTLIDGGKASPEEADKEPD